MNKLIAFGLAALVSTGVYASEDEPWEFLACSVSLGEDTSLPFIILDDCMYAGKSRGCIRGVNDDDHYFFQKSENVKLIILKMDNRGAAYFDQDDGVTRNVYDVTCVDMTGDKR